MHAGGRLYRIHLLGTFCVLGPDSLWPIFNAGVQSLDVLLLTPLCSASLSPGACLVFFGHCPSFPDSASQYRPALLGREGPKANGNEVAYSLW